MVPSQRDRSESGAREHPTGEAGNARNAATLKSEKRNEGSTLRDEKWQAVKAAGRQGGEKVKATIHLTLARRLASSRLIISYFASHFRTSSGSSIRSAGSHAEVLPSAE